MGESYVELMWRVIKYDDFGPQLKAAFLDLDAAKEYAKLIDGRVVVITHKFIE